MKVTEAGGKVSEFACHDVYLASPDFSISKVRFKGMIRE